MPPATFKIPSHVKIGGITYVVQIVSDWLDSGGADGELKLEPNNIIYIKSTLSQQAKEVTFIHECLHAMNSTVNHEFLDSHAEQIYAFLIDNNFRQA